MPSGGEVGQVLTKTSDDDYDFGWSDASVSEGDYEDITDEDIDALFEIDDNENDIATKGNEDESKQK